MGAIKQYLHYHNLQNLVFGCSLFHLIKVRVTKVNPCLCFKLVNNDDGSLNMLKPYTCSVLSAHHSEPLFINPRRTQLNETKKKEARKLPRGHRKKCNELKAIKARGQSATLLCNNNKKLCGP